MTAPTLPSPEDVLTFWFGAPGSPLGEREVWWNADPAFDREVRDRFANLHRAVRAGELAAWLHDARGALAYVLVLDQFTRHLYRGHEDAYSCDIEALAAARLALTRGWDRVLAPRLRQFLFMPFMHAEDIDAQEESVRLFARLAAEDASVDQRKWALEHRELIRLHGRFPHRDQALGRTIDG